MSNDASLISMHPFFRRFVFSVIQTIREREGISVQRVIVDTDMIPGGSHHVARASIEREPLPLIVQERELPVRKASAEDLNKLVAPINVKPKVEPEKVIVAPEPVMEASEPVVVKERPVIMPTPKPVPVIVPAKISPPVEEKVEMPSSVGEGYDLIAPLLEDNSVSTVECLGKGKELMVIRAGQKQKTRIVLSAEQIKDILEVIADKAHIPLMEGVFRATVDNFSVNAVVSEMVGNRFIIKKANAYSMLE